MKTKEIALKGLQFENGDIILAVSNGRYFVKTTDGIFAYTETEMLKIYDFTDKG